MVFVFNFGIVINCLGVLDGVVGENGIFIVIGGIDEGEVIVVVVLEEVVDDGGD